MYHIWLDGREKISKKFMHSYKVSMTFEGYTGADVIITPLKDFLSKESMQLHLDSGAIMIQVKHGRDLDSSVIDRRISESQLRMNTWQTHAYQCGLLITGKFEIINGYLFINGEKSRLRANAYLGALNSWIFRGGVVYPAIEPEYMQAAIDLMAQKLFIKDPIARSLSSKPRKKFKEVKIFTSGMGLREKAKLSRKSIDEHDVRHLLVNIQGLTSGSIAKIWRRLEVKNMSGFVDFVLNDNLLKIKGIGPKTNSKIKKQLGFDN